MKKILLIFLMIILNWQGSMSKISEVFLCNSSGGKKYHYTNSCRGLSPCKSNIIKVSLQKAQSLGKELCGWE